VKGSRVTTYAIPGARARILNVYVGYLPHFCWKNLTEKEASMNTIDNDKNFGTRLVALKAKFYDFTRKVAIRESKKRENVSRSNQDLNMPITEMSSGIEELVNEGPGDWAPQMKNIDNGLVPMRGNYVLRPRLSWTGLYGKEPWPRERKQWEKV
jgi:hypothetical protein